jgi:ParB/RepB/Spo0J family partition protein
MSKRAHQISGESAEAGSPERGATEFVGTPEHEPSPVTLPQSPIESIPLDRIIESEWNPRQHYPPREMNELASSMRETGFRDWLPLVGRPYPEGSQRDKLIADGIENPVELAAGHRRRRAAYQAGLTHVPCIVRPMSDEEFLDVLNFDNTGRQDVHPLHESAGWQDWMQRTGKGVKDIAARLGVSIEYVYQRLKYADLIEPARVEFLNGRLKGAHAVLIARLPEKLQHDALAYCFPPFDPDRTISVAQLRQWIANNCYRSLGNLPFDVMDESLIPDAGGCMACPKRAGNLSELYADLEPHTCTDPACFRAKSEAAIALECKPAEAWDSDARIVYPQPDPVESPAPRERKPKRDEAEEQRQTEENRRLAEQRAAETAANRRKEERAEKVYRNTVDAILAKVKGVTPQDAVAILEFLAAGALDRVDEMADKFAIVKHHDARWMDVGDAARKLSPAKVARMIIFGMLTDISIQEGLSRHTSPDRVRAPVQGGHREDRPIGRCGDRRTPRPA